MIGGVKKRPWFIEEVQNIELRVRIAKGCDVVWDEDVPSS